MPKVLNKYRDTIPKDAVWIMRGYKYGNPYVIGKDGNRGEVCDKYELYADKKFTDEEIKADLEGRDLVCCCTPQRCHGNYLLMRANK